jgi:hypothetical protein
LAYCASVFLENVLDFLRLRSAGTGAPFLPRLGGDCTVNKKKYQRNCVSFHLPAGIWYVVLLSFCKKELQEQDCFHDFFGEFSPLNGVFKYLAGFLEY